MLRTNIEFANLDRGARTIMVTSADPSNTITRTSLRIGGHNAVVRSRIRPPMRPRIVVLLFVAIASGLVAGFVGKATAGKARGAAPQAPKAIYGACPIPARYRAAFEQADRETHLGLALLAAVANVESIFGPTPAQPPARTGSSRFSPRRRRI